MQTYKNYQEAKAQTGYAASWVALKSDRDSQSGKLFSLSPAHSKLMLMRCGQHSCGGQNYHESPPAFNSALLDVIAKNFDDLAEKALDLLRERERQALIACESELAELNSAITTAKGY